MASSVDHVLSVAACFAGQTGLGPDPVKPLGDVATALLAKQRKRLDLPDDPIDIRRAIRSSRKAR